MPRSYASGYSRSSQREPSLVWFLLGAVAIAVGYLYISGLSDDEVKPEEGKGEVAKAKSTAGATSSVSEGGTNEGGGVVVRQAIPVIEEDIGAVPQAGSAWKSGSPNVMSWIPGGKYMVRTEAGIAAKEFPGGFWLAVRPISERAYQDLVGTNPVPEGKRDPEAPVTRVNWDEASAYARMLTRKEWQEGRLPKNYEYRLPDETMWEYATGGGEDGNALRVREEGSRSLSWWRLNGVREFRDSIHEGPLRAGPLDIGLVTEWTSDDVEDSDGGMGVKVTRGAPHTAFLGRQNEIAKIRYTIYHKDEKLPFLGFRIVLVKTGPDPEVAAAEEKVEERSGEISVRALRPGEEVDYVRRNAFNLDQLFETSQFASSGRVTKYQTLRKVQTELKKYGYYRARVDGYPGKSTQKAIDQFQAVSGLPKTGKLDDETLESLGIVFEETSGPGDRTADASSSDLPDGPTVPNPSETRETRPEPRTPLTVIAERTRSSAPDPVESSSAPVSVEPPSRPVRRALLAESPESRPATDRPPTSVAIDPPPVVPAGGYERERRELRYDGFRGKLRKVKDSVLGVYDPREDR